MALTYQLYCPLDRDELQARFDAFTREVDVTTSWEPAEARPTSALQRELRAEEGYPGPFGSSVNVKIYKDNRWQARALLKRFFATLPEPKVVLFEGEPLKDQEGFRRLDPESG